MLAYMLLSQYNNSGAVCKEIEDLDRQDVLYPCS